MEGTAKKKKLSEKKKLPISEGKIKRTAFATLVER